MLVELGAPPALVPRRLSTRTKDRHRLSTRTTIAPSGTRTRIVTGSARAPGQRKTAAGMIPAAALLRWDVEAAQAIRASSQAL